MRRLTLLLLVFASCKTLAPYNLAETTTSKIDYSDLKHWAAHPDKTDLADNVPGQKDLADQSNFPIDVFFVHPTSHTKKKRRSEWNAHIADPKINQATDEGSIKYQASLFNQVGRVYAPRYRQAHIHSYMTSDSTAAKKAFARAYEDVEQAFKFYIDNYNQGRPFIIASHSQGTTHAVPLIENLVDGESIQSQLVAAYLVGMPVLKEQFENLQPCELPDQTACYVSWRTYKHGYMPEHWTGDNILCTNPLSWTLTKELVPKENNKGALLRNFNKILTKRADAQIINGILWTHKPKFPGSFLLTRNNYHIADFNFYYFDVQHNAQLRAKKFLSSM